MEIIRDSVLGYPARRLFPSKFRYPEEISQACNVEGFDSTAAGPIARLSQQATEHLYVLEENSQPGHLSEISSDQDSQKLDGKTSICRWYGDDDPENPHNWSRPRKLFVVANVAACSFVVYGTAPIWTPSSEAYMSEYGTNHAYTWLGLSLFVLGYGIGPLLFSPLSEIPRIGRNIPYVSTFLLYMLLSIPLALVKSNPAFMFLRFAQGFLGSPILATGGASLSDIYSDTYLPFAISAWSGACFIAPAITPIISSAALPYLGWRFSMWEVLIAAAPVFIMLLLWPETSESTILYWRARRLRQMTGNPTIRSAAEVTQTSLSFADGIAEALLMPARITALDPAILFANIYMMLVYGIYYSFFESFPLVYGPVYGFNLLQSNLAFLPLAVGTVIALILYTAYLYFYRLPRTLAGSKSYPEQVLIPAMVSCFCPPIGLLTFGWSAEQDLHWTASMIGVAIYPLGVFIIFQGIFLYLPKSYPQYAASLFAAADTTRSLFAFAAIHFARPLFMTLGIGGGCSLLAGLMILCIFGLYALYFYGPALRARSKFAR